MGMEFELKYRATAELLARLRRDIAGSEQIFQMSTTYYDTPTGQFAARHCTLRCRQENDIRICTLKTPTDGIGRREWETRSDCIEEGVGKLCKLGGPAEILSLAQEGLVPVCAARFTRIAKTVELENCVVEMALDDGILTGGDRQIPLCEIEIELKAGAARDCVAYANELENIYGLIPEDRSKFRRALALYRGEI